MAFDRAISSGNFLTKEPQNCTAVFLCFDRRLLSGNAPFLNGNIDVILA
jgi:hypothetical protein